jgi:hypothetical protein
MRQKYSFAILVLFLFTATAVRAQSGSEESRSEVGAFYTGINLNGFGETVNGIGGRVAYNLDEHLAVEAEASFFPETHLGNNQLGQKVQAFMGIKSGVRSRYIGVFVKARPGVMFIGEITSAFNCSGSGAATICSPSHNNLALDLGGILELYPSSRTLIRFDADDTMVRIRRATIGIFSNPPAISDTTNNFQFSVGFGYRF